MILEEQMSIKDTQIQHHLNQGKKNYDQFILDRDSLHLEIQHLKKQILSKENDHKNCPNLQLILERDRKLFEEENNQLKKINHNLKDEIIFLRSSTNDQKNSLQKNYLNLEHEFNQRNAEYVMKIKELEIKNKGLTDLSQNQTRQIEYLKKEIGENGQKRVSIDSRNNSYNNTSRDLKTSASSKKLKTPFKSTKNLGIRERSKSPRCETCSSHTPKPNSPPRSSLKKRSSHLSLPTISISPEKSESALSDTIQTLEKELSNLNLRYKHLLQSSQEGTSNLPSLRQEISEVSSLIQQKSDGLYELKRKRHSLLREKLLS